MKVSKFVMLMAILTANSKAISALAFVVGLIVLILITPAAMDGVINEGLTLIPAGVCSAGFWGVVGIGWWWK